MVGHLDGHEENEAPDNLTWTCRPCNSTAANTMRKAGKGRKTRQFNPSKSGGASSLGEWMQAVGAITPHVDRGDRGLASTMSVSEAVAMIRATPHSRRSEFASKLGASRRGRRRAENPLFGPGGVFGSRETVYDIRAAKKAGEQSRKLAPYRGYQIFKTSDGEYYSSLDRDSWYSSVSAVHKAIDSFKKGRNENPSTATVKHEKEIRAYIEQKRAAGWNVEQLHRAIWRRWGYLGQAKDGVLHLKMSTGMERFQINPSHDLEMEARTSRNKEELQRLLNYARGKKDAELKRVVEARAKDLGIKLNPAKFDRCVKAVQKKDGAANAYAVCTKAGTRKKNAAGPFYPALRKKRTNPATASAEAFEDFHGYPSTELITVKKKVHHHKHLASAGELRALRVKGIDGNVHVISGFKGALLCFNESRNQLFVEGGDQSINLEDFGITSPHELETLGKLKGVDYFTDKTHLGDEGGTAVYQHGFRMTNENGQHVIVTIARYPDLIYRVLDEQLEFSGGSYTIRREGIDL